MTITQPGRLRMIPELLYGSASLLLEEWPTVDGANAALPSNGHGTITVYNAGGAVSSIVDAVTNFVSAGTMQYTIDISNTSTWTLNENYEADWTFTDTGGKTYRMSTVFDIVLNQLQPFIPITIDDIKNVDPLIDDFLSNAGMSTDAAARFIEPAWFDVYSWLRSRGRRPYLTADRRTLFSVTKWKAVENIARAMSPSGSSDRWAQLADHARKEYERAQAQTNLRYRLDPATRQNDSLRGTSQPDIGTGPDHVYGTITNWRNRMGYTR